jgi:predicted metal-dependent enzyme (double-stranded beta helix superfamily)
VRAGKYPYIGYSADERWHQRVYRDQRIDVWLISWLPTQGTHLHDHGGSSGALTVVSGSLTEAVYSMASGLRDVERSAGRSVGFAGHYVHDVRNTAASPSVSVHVYSPPLTSMNFYDVVDGALVPLASMPTDDPEIEFSVQEAS